MTLKRLSLFLLVALALAALTACGSASPTPTAVQPDASYPAAQPQVTLDLSGTPGYAAPQAQVTQAVGYPEPGKDVTNSEALKPLEMNGASIVYVRSGGLQGLTTTYRIYPDGKVELDGNAAGPLTPEQVTALVNTAKTAGFFDLTETAFMAPNCRDCFTYSLAITADGKTQQVTAQDAATLPAPVSTMIQSMETLTASLPK